MKATMRSFKDYPHDVGELKDSSSLIDSPQALSRCLENDGYLFVRNLLPVNELLALRAAITDILAESGWIRGGAEKMEARAVGMPYREGEEGYFQALDRIVRLEKLYALAQTPKLLTLMKRVLGDTAFPHPLSITRLVFPQNNEVTTPPHQDYPNNQGTQHLTAAWVPLGDCSLSQGPIAVLEGSHKFGVLPLDFHLGPGNRRAVLDERFSGLRWLSADFRAGDVLLFPALTVHSALENNDKELMRLSVDFRYQLEGEELVEQSLHPHFGRVSWDDIYSGWANDELKYYWKKKNYKLVEWDQSLQDLPDDHIKEAVKQTRAYNKSRQERHQSGNRISE